MSSSGQFSGPPLSTLRGSLQQMGDFQPALTWRRNKESRLALRGNSTSAGPGPLDDGVSSKTTRRNRSNKAKRIQTGTLFGLEIREWRSSSRTQEKRTRRHQLRRGIALPGFTSSPIDRTQDQSGSVSESQVGFGRLALSPRGLKDCQVAPHFLFARFHQNG